MVITALRADHRASGRVVVETDGTRFTALPAEEVSELGLRVGLELDGSTYEKLRYAADVEAARQVALRLLAARPRAVNDLLRRLRDRGLNPAAVAQVVGQLETDGLLDDTAFAQHYVRVRHGRGHGPARLLHDLLGHGVDRRLAERAIDSVFEAEGVNPTSQARRIAEKRAKQLGDIPRAVKRRRLVAYLRRRGFGGRDVSEMVEEVMGALEQGC